MCTFRPWSVLSLRPPTSGRFEDPWADEEMVLGHPEKEVLSYLDTCASALGLALDLEAKICALRTLRSATLGDGSGATAAPTATPATASASSSGSGESGADLRNSSGTRKDEAARAGEGVRHKPGTTVSSTQDVYAAVATALSRALVHCKRFEVSTGRGSLKYK